MTTEPTTAVIEAGVREAQAAGAGWCLTLTAADDPKRWVQFANGMLVAAFPHKDDPIAWLSGLGRFGIAAWTAGAYLEGRLEATEPDAIARWIDGYFQKVLGCPAEAYALEKKLERF